MKDYLCYLFFLLLLLFVDLSFADYGGPLYDHYACSECKPNPEEPLYGGGIIKNKTQISGNNIHPPSFSFHNLTGSTVYCFSSWIKTTDADSVVIKAKLYSGNNTSKSIGIVIAKLGCWSFLKGGFVLDSSSSFVTLSFENPDGKTFNMTVASPSLQAFSEEEWRMNQQRMINTTRQREAIVNVVDEHGDNVRGAEIKIEQVSKEFPLGSAISSTILGNLPYQKWFVERFNAAVFENELKWNATEIEQGKFNYTVTDKMLEFLRAHQILVRGHNVLWEQAFYLPYWVQNLNAPDLKLAVQSRIQSLMTKYKNEFVHWDVDNEMLHYDFFEQKLGPHIYVDFYKMVQQSDPLATLFLNDFNVLEEINDPNPTLDNYISRLRELESSGIVMDGIGLEGHYIKPNPPLTRAILDKLATLKRPIWITEVDIGKNIDQITQGKYLEVVLREVFSHPSVNGIMIWAALHPSGRCDQMCLTDTNFRNLPAGDVVDKLLKEWQTGVVEGTTNDNGCISFSGFLGEYKVSVNFGNKKINSTFSLCRGEETKHVTILV